MLRKRNDSGFSFIEAFIVSAIVSLVMGMAFTFLTTSRIASDVNEAQLQVQEHARKAMDTINRELRFSNPSRVRISNSLSWAAEISPGGVINFQIPVGIYNDALDLEDGSTIKWGCANNEGHYIAYSINGSSELLRSTYTDSIGSGLSRIVVTSGISAVGFSRSTPDSSLIHIAVTAQVEGPRGPVVRTLESDVKLRNF